MEISEWVSYEKLLIERKLYWKYKENHEEQSNVVVSLGILTGLKQTVCLGC